MKISKFILLISIFLLLSSFSSFDKISLEEFTKNKLSNFSVLREVEGNNFVVSIERQKLYKEKTELKVKARKSHSNKNSYNNTVFTRIKMWEFLFSNVENCVTTLDSLLTCFPNDCAKIKRGEDKAVKINTSIWILNNKSFYVAQTPCEQVDGKWEQFKKDYIETFAETDSEIIITDCGSLKWKTK